MGQRLPDEPIDIGTECSTCFAAGQTPKFVFARFAEIEKCPDPLCTPLEPPPNDRAFKLEQVVGSPCVWRFDGPVWRVTWFAVDTPPFASSLIILHQATFFDFFSSRTAPPDFCRTFFLNEATCASGECGIGGQGIITWTPQATQILEDINLRKANDLFMELRPLVDGKLVYKFCKLQDATNIAILFDPTV